jgi:hypothetical protein
MKLFGFEKPNIEALRAKSDINGLLAALLSSESQYAAKQALDSINPNWTKSNEARKFVPKFINVLNNKSIQPVLRDTIRILGDIGDERAIKPLLSIIEDTNSPHKDEAVKALGKIGSDIAVEPLLQTLFKQQDKIWEDRTARFTKEIILALGEIGSKTAIDPLNRFRLSISHPRKGFAAPSQATFENIDLVIKRLSQPVKVKICANHQFDNWVYLDQNSCVQTRVCKICFTKETQTRHRGEWKSIGTRDAEISASGARGYVEYFRCSVCSWERQGDSAWT